MPIIIAIILLIGSIYTAMNIKNNQINNEPHDESSTIETNTSVSSESNVSKPTENEYDYKELDEMRGIWIPFMSLDMKGTDYSESAFKSKFDNIVEQSKAYGLNTLVVHVRPYGDSLYPSEIFPWSHLLTGTQGNNPGFDPLAYMVEKTHAEGLEFHAWVNPLRIQSKETPSNKKLTGINAQ